MADDKTKIYLGWQKFGEMVEELVTKIKSSDSEFDGVYGIPRGGLAIALVLSHKLDIPLLMQPALDCLIVDDISDTGKALNDYRDHRIATLYTTSWTRVDPDWFIDYKMNKGDWIKFPWEGEKD
jgi:hypoxanthine phosphoribosyltransferase